MSQGDGQCHTVRVYTLFVGDCDRQSTVREGKETEWVTSVLVTGLAHKSQLVRQVMWSSCPSFAVSCLSSKEAGMLFGLTQDDRVYFHAHAEGTVFVPLGKRKWIEWLVFGFWPWFVLKGVAAATSLDVLGLVDLGSGTYHEKKSKIEIIIYDRGITPPCRSFVEMENRFRADVMLDDHRTSENCLTDSSIGLSMSGQSLISLQMMDWIGQQFPGNLFW